MAAGGAAALILAACGFGAPEPAKGPVLAEIHAGRNIGPPVIGAGSVWVANRGDGTVSRIDPATNRVVATITIGNPIALQDQSCGPASIHSLMRDTLLIRRCDEPFDIATDGTRVWAIDNTNRTLAEIDPATNQVARRLTVGEVSFGIAYGEGSLWLTNVFANPHSVIRLDPSTGQRQATITGLPIGGATGIAVGAGAVWTAANKDQAVLRIDPATNRVVATIPVRQYPLAVSVGPGAVWVHNEDSSSVSRIDPATNQVVAEVPAPPPVGGPGVDAMAAGPDGLWVPGVTLQHVDPATNRVAGIIDLSGGGVTEGFSSLWMTSVVGTVQRIDPQAATPVRS
jgi:YVTN family beta-propeller protein